jgi:hypothetical protein
MSCDINKKKQLDSNHTQEGIAIATSLRGRANKAMGSRGKPRKQRVRNKNLSISDDSLLSPGTRAEQGGKDGMGTSSSSLSASEGAAARAKGCCGGGTCRQGMGPHGDCAITDQG